ncbi:MAG: hypothetical protein M3Q60_17775 [Actinomycetota bacterium]|nr:hypothetical protein [Actinomycetota bacterium]
MSSAYWLIAGCEPRGVEVLTVELLGGAGSPDGQRILPVFGYGEEAEAFLEALRQDRLPWGKACVTPASSGWRIRETTRGELVSLLCGACAGVHGVLLDPPPELEAGMPVDLVGVGRQSFIERLLGRGRAWFHDRHETGASDEADASASRQRDRSNLKP